MANSIFTLQPTFTQGFIIGQFSILFLLALILKYLFWSSGPEPQFTSLPPRTEPNPRHESLASVSKESKQSLDQEESVEWLNLMLLKVFQTYRADFREHLTGPDAVDLVRQKIEAKLNEARPASFTDAIKVHSIDLGTSSPRLSRGKSQPSTSIPSQMITNFDITYQDTVSISLSTSILLHYPRPHFARLPIAITLSLSLFSSQLLLIPPDPESKEPSLTFTLPPDFTLDIQTNSLLGSRAKLADVPKIHEMICLQIRRFLVQRGTWTIMLPPLTPKTEPTATL